LAENFHTVRGNSNRKLASFRYPKGGVEQMRKLLAVALLATFASTASASQLGLRFVDNGSLGADETNTAVNIGDSVTVEVTWTQDAQEATVGLSNAFFLLTSSVHNGPGSAAAEGALVEDADLVVGNSGTTIGAWGTGGADGTVGGLSAIQYAGNDASFLNVAGTTVIGTFDITVGPGAILGSVHDFYILRRAGAASPDLAHPPGASSYSFNLGDPNGYEGNYNIGNGFAGKNNGDLAIPMNITVTPEPAALALLALGGVAVLRRRS
jgi:MYXO-CTERM domain-containing protein